MTYWVPVYSSSNVEAIRYHEPSRECQVKFVKGGDIYTFLDVSPEEFENFKNAGSKGRFVQIYLRRTKQYRKEGAVDLFPAPKPESETPPAEEV